jgi:hypothetical protein
MNSVVGSSRRYERWLAKRLTLVPRDLRLKHRRMAESAFTFLRGSFFRWVELWPQECAALVAAPRVLGVADLHAENFGTWRDREGRLAWGVNDFDEAAVVPYTNDLVRLCTSAALAIADCPWHLTTRRACDAVLDGYRESLERGGVPIVLGKHHVWLREITEARLKNEPHFWRRLMKHATVRVPRDIRRLLSATMPQRGLKFRAIQRSAGIGSLGRQRFTAIAPWRGGVIAREAKALTGSAWRWLRTERPGSRLCYAEIVKRAVRMHDPSLRIRSSMAIRRIAPDCRKVEFTELPAKANLQELLRMMGSETANVHLGTRRARRAILADLAHRRRNWLEDATARMRDATLEDWRAWRKRHSRSRLTKIVSASSADTR